MINVVISGGETLPVPKGLKMRLLEQTARYAETDSSRRSGALHRSPFQLVLPDLPNPDISASESVMKLPRMEHDSPVFAFVNDREIAKAVEVPRCKAHDVS
jgi:DNA-binding NtrC family response regulator